MSIRFASPLLGLVSVAACVTEQGPLTNRMAQATTGYLSRAARQPVSWQTWGPEAFALAAKLDRPVLLVVGADRCRPCAEMDRVWEDAGLAALVNALFVPVRVDRDERPDVAHRYRAVVRTLSGLEGYPLTVFLTADGSAFFGGTTFPTDDPLTGRGLRQILPEAARAYRERREAIEQRAATAQALAAGRPAMTNAVLGPSTVAAGVEAIRSALTRFDAAATSPVTLARGAELLFAWFAEQGDSADLRLAQRILMPLVATGAGASEPAVLQRAVFVRALVRGWAATGEPRFRAAARRELAALGEELALSTRRPQFTDVIAFGVGAALVAGPAIGDSATPALARAVLDTLLRRVYASGLGARHATVESVRGLLEDQVHLAGACLAAFDVTGDAAYVGIARELVALVERDYADPLGGFFDTAVPDPAVPTHLSKRVLDNGLPGPNAWAARVLLDLAAATGDDSYRRRADATLEAFAGVAVEGGLLAAGYFDVARAAVARRRH